MGYKFTRIHNKYLHLILISIVKAFSFSFSIFFIIIDISIIKNNYRCYDNINVNL